MRHESHINSWVVIDGVRTSYRGFLLGVYEVSDGAILQFHPVSALESLQNTNNEVKIPSTDDKPFEIYSQAILGIGSMPNGWDRSIE